MSKTEPTTPTVSYCRQTSIAATSPPGRSKIDRGGAEGAAGEIEPGHREADQCRSQDGRRCPRTAGIDWGHSPVGQDGGSGRQGSRRLTGPHHGQ